MDDTLTVARIGSEDTLYMSVPRMNENILVGAARAAFNCTTSLCPEVFCTHHTWLIMQQEVKHICLHQPAWQKRL